MSAGVIGCGVWPVAGRLAGSGRPVAAVGAVRRPEWISANGSSGGSGNGHSTASSDDMLMDTAAQCRPFPLVSAVPYASAQPSMLIADAGDATLPHGGPMLLNNSCFLPPTMSDEALLSDLTAANSAGLYPIDG